MPHSSKLAPESVRNLSNSIATFSLNFFQNISNSSLDRKKEVLPKKVYSIFIFRQLTCFRYMDFFPEHEKPDDVLYMEKSANYFDSLKTPLRAHNIIPNAKLIIISIDPKLRAYSWYQVKRSSFGIFTPELMSRVPFVPSSLDS